MKPTYSLGVVFEFLFFKQRVMSKILVIEDEAAIRRVLIKILSEESDDYQVFEAEDGIKE